MGVFEQENAMSIVLILHMIFVICWFAGLFYLPRLFVYHAEATDKISLDRFKIMERKLFWGIMTPSAVIAILTGGLLIRFYAWNIFQTMLWLKLKVVFALFLLIYHGYCWHYLRRFQQERNPHSHVFYRWFNELPVVLLIGIVTLIVLKPF
jgi:putative membrane protein